MSHKCRTRGYGRPTVLIIGSWVPTRQEICAGQGLAYACPSFQADFFSKRPFQRSSPPLTSPHSQHLVSVPHFPHSWSLGQALSTQACRGDGKKTLPISCFWFLLREIGKSSTAMPWTCCYRAGPGMAEVTGRLYSSHCQPFVPS